MSTTTATTYIHSICPNCHSEVYIKIIGIRKIGRCSSCGLTRRIT